MDALMGEVFQNSLKSKGISIEPLYRAMRSNDLCDAVLAARDIFHITNFFNHIPRFEHTKSELRSNNFREEGNVAYRAGHHQLALECYNKALAYAPEDSLALKLGYSNRSALLIKSLNVSACLNDIERCFAMGCPINIKEKLLKRKAEAENILWVEQLAMETTHTPYIRNFFTVNGGSNPDIPCASAYIDIIEENGSHKIVTTKDIKVGTVLAKESAFTTLLNDSNKYFACYYCTKLSMNLIPCPGCCHVLFCSENCKKKSFDEGHSVECHFMDIVFGMDMLKVHFAFKSALKMKNMCTWEELINASHIVGVNRIKNSTIKELFDINEKFSLLTAKDDKLFIYGKNYYSSFACAIIMHCIKDAAFLPAGLKEKTNAINALIRITVYMFLYAPTMVVTPSASAVKHATQLHVNNFGCYLFMSKLKHSCHANCVAVCLNDKQALVCTAPIKAGTELTVTQFGQFKSHERITAMNTRKFNRQLFRFYGTTCNCICSVNKLTPQQKKLIRRLDIANLMENAVEDVPEVYPKLCRVLTSLSNATHTDDYEMLYDLFLGCILRAQDIATHNVVIEHF